MPRGNGPDSPRFWAVVQGGPPGAIDRGSVPESANGGVRATVEALRVPFEGGTLWITVSIGVCTGTQDTPQAMVSAADERLCLAKVEVRNRVVLEE